MVTALLSRQCIGSTLRKYKQAAAVFRAVLASHPPQQTSSQVRKFEPSNNAKAV